MIFTTRDAARAAGATKYNTGRPCANGHIADRYVQSGTCMGCIAANVKRSAERKHDLGLFRARFRVFPDQADMVFDAMTAMVRLRYPDATRAQVVADQRGTKPTNGTFLYAVDIVEEDRKMLADMANALLSSRTAPVDMAAIRGPVIAEQMRTMNLPKLELLPQPWDNA